MKVGRKVKKLLVKLLKPIIKDTVQEICKNEISVWGDPTRLHLDKNCFMVNALFNVSSGEVWVGENTFCGHNVSILTGSHDYRITGLERVTQYPRSGNDIRIGVGVWIGSNATILGPCIIGDNSVIAAGSVVTKDVWPNSIVAGVPARLIKTIELTT